mmetsp:Transcript_20117/g.45771  ORF Transcript_20117/g.45771 Transcript_20117/m.45771 type:complete len:564 (-) Transcript_20117:443-2134(-)
MSKTTLSPENLISNGRDNDKEVLEYVRKAQFSLRGWMCELLAFIIFLAAFTASTMMFKDRGQTHHLEELFRSKIVPSEDIATPDTFWNFVLNNVGQVLLVNNSAFSNNSFEFGNMYVPTGIRLRQLRVGESACSRTAKRLLVQQCFGTFNFHDEEKIFLGPDGNSPQGIASKVANAYQWKDSTETDEIIQWGYFGLYPGGGFFIDINNYQDLVSVVAELQQHQWVDIKTRVTFVDFEVYSANLDIWMTSRTISEWLPSGVVSSFFQFRAVKLDRYNLVTAWDHILVGLEVLVAVMVIWHLIQEVVELINQGCSAYVTNFWNFLELANIFFLGVVAFLRVKDSLKMNYLMANPNFITSPKLQNLAFWVSQEDNFIAISALIMWLKLLKFARLTTRLNRIAFTLKRAFPDVIAFVFIFLVAWIAYSITGVLILGSDLPEYSDFLGAFGASFNAMFGNFDAQRLYNANRFIGPFYMFSWLALSCLLLLNLLLAILAHHFAAVCSAQDLDLPILKELELRRRAYSAKRRIHPKKYERPKSGVPMTPSKEADPLDHVDASIVDSVMVR